MDINNAVHTPRRTLTSEQLARLLGLTVATIRTYSTAREYQHLLPRHFKRPGGRRLLWWEDEILHWMAAGRAPTLQRTARPRGRPFKAESLRREVERG